MKVFEIKEVVREDTVLPDGSLRRLELDPKTSRSKQVRAWIAKTEATMVCHLPNFMRNAFAEPLRFQTNS